MNVFDRKNWKNFQWLVFEFQNLFTDSHTATGGIRNAYSVNKKSRICPADVTPRVFLVVPSCSCQVFSLRIVSLNTN